MTSDLRRSHRERLPLWKALRGSEGAVLALALLSFVINLLMLTGPLFMLQVYDRVLASRSVGTLLVLALFAGILYVFYGVFDALRARLAWRMADQVERGWRQDLFARDIASRFAQQLPFDPARESDAMRTFMSSAAMTSLMDVPWVPLYVAVVFVIHPTLGWLAVAGVVLVSLLLVIGEALSRSATRHLADASGAKATLLDAARRGAESIKAMGMNSSVGARFERVSTEVAEAQRVQVDRTSTVSAASKSVRFMLQSGVLATGAYLVIQGEMSAGSMIAASVITSRALAPVEQVVGQWRPIANARLAWKRLSTMLAVSTVGETDRVRLPAPRNTLTVQDLALQVGDSGPLIVASASFALAAGDGLGILGSSGAGKTTLLRGVAGVWPARRGLVRLDGAELGHYDEEARGAAVGYLSQQVDLIEGTIAENIARGIDNADSDAILTASSRASAHEMIVSLPNGYETLVGRDGMVLSAGQRQRIGLARALYGDPFLVLLDEPSSNLDAKGDEALAGALRGVRARGGIVIAVSHRPSTLREMNKLLVLEAGTIRAFGDRQEVLERGIVAAS